MTIERYYPQDDPDPDDQGPSPRRPDQFDELGRRAREHGQAARDAIARIAGSANPEHLLNQLKNQGGE